MAATPEPPFHEERSMSSRSLRVIVILVAFMTRLLPWPVAAEPHARVPRCNSVFEHALGFVAQIWAKIGCTIDPDGLCVPSPGGQSTQDGEIGCELDPNGYCIQRPTAQGTPQNQGEIGCTIDPNGYCIR
jgi:hypothetical protein